MSRLISIATLGGCFALSSCSTLMEVIGDPEVQEAFIQTATDAATGNWFGAVCGVGATIAAIAGHKTIKRRAGKKKQQSNS